MSETRLFERKEKVRILVWKMQIIALPIQQKAYRPDQASPGFTLAQVLSSALFACGSW
jgi:hypothetical protein